MDVAHWKVQGSNPLTETLLLLTKNRKSLVVYLTDQTISGAHKVQVRLRFGWMVHTGRFKVQTLSLTLFCY